jgi:hypothetical protein
MLYSIRFRFIHSFDNATSPVSRGDATIIEGNIDAGIVVSRGDALFYLLPIHPLVR